MIIVENIIINGKEFMKTYSDNNKYIEREGIKYLEAIDPIDSKREYIETDVDIETEE